MSTYFYMECQDHNPPLPADFEISQHDDDYVAAAIEYVVNEQPPWMIRDRLFWINGMPEALDVWLKTHAACHIDVVSEYGDHRVIPGRSLPDTKEGRP